VTLNLYIVMDANYEWGCFVFDASRNRAKMRVAYEFGADYIDMRCKTLARGVNMDFPMLVDCPEHEGYDLVERLGFHYGTDEEEEATP